MKEWFIAKRRFTRLISSEFSGQSEAIVHILVTSMIKSYFEPFSLAHTLPQYI